MVHISRIANHYRPHPKDGEGNVFTSSTPGGGGGQVSPAGGGGQVSPAGGGSVQPGGVSPAGGGVSIFRPLAGSMPLAFTQEDFLVVH